MSITDGAHTATDALDALDAVSALHLEAVAPAVANLLQSSEDKAGDASRLLGVLERSRARFGEEASPVLDRIALELKLVAQDPESSEDDGDAEGTPFGLGPNRMSLAALLNIASAIDPEDYTRSAGTCKSLCIAININLQYMYFLVRLIRLVMLGADNVQSEVSESSDDDTVSSDSSSSTCGIGK